MIFLSTGTQLPFERLVRAVDEWADEAQPSCEIFGQTLAPREKPYTPRNFKTVERLTPTEYESVFDRATLLISHAGMGTILTALTKGKKICVMPRLAKYGEHRNNHQSATVERLKDHPNLFKAADEVELRFYIRRALENSGVTQSAGINPLAASALTETLRCFILSREK